MKKALLILSNLFLVLCVKGQNVGIGTPFPATSLDVKGGFRIQPKLIPLTASIITIPDNESNILLQAGYAGDFSVTITTAQPGQRLIIDNQTGYIGAIEQDELIEKGMNEYIYSLGKWKIANKDMSSWQLTGNAGTTVTNYIGTSDAQPIRFRTHGNRNVGLLDNVRTNYHIGGGLPNAAAYTGLRNVSLGYLSSSNLETGSDNVSLGFYSLFSNKTGTDNVAIGTWAMRFNKVGGGNVAIGQYASAYDTSSNGNIAVGSQALQFNQSRGGNTAIGSAALQYNTNTSSIGSKEGEINTAIGAYSLNKNLRGSGAVAIGAYAAFSDTAAEGIVAIGRGALFSQRTVPINFLGQKQGGTIAIGDSALFYNGINSLDGSFEGEGNIAIGSKSLLNNREGYSNTAIGQQTLTNNISGFLNIAVGLQALKANTTGFRNSATGGAALILNTTGNNNSALGSSSLRNNTTGNNNSGLGQRAIANNTTGNDNVGVGDSVLWLNTTGNRNVALGHLAGFNSNSSDKLYIANSDSKNLIYGDFAADSLLLNAKTINKFSLNVRGSNALEMGYGAAGKQTDAGKICYGCFGDPANWLGIVGGGTAALGTDRVIKLWSEGGLRIRGNALPDFNNTYSLGTSGQRWSEVWTNAGAINTSDARLKTNIVVSPYGLTEVMQMQPVQYNWKTNPNNDLQIGFLAQDIQKIIPEAVVVPANGDPLGMKYNELIPVLVKGIQEQQKLIESQQKQIDELYKILKAKL